MKSSIDKENPPSREHILNESMTADNEKTFAPGFTVRRISPTEEFLLSKIGSPILSAPSLAKIAEDPEAAGKTFTTDALYDLLFICSEEPQTVRALIRGGGRAAFDDAVFAFVRKLPSREAVDEAVRWLIADIYGISLAQFDAVPDESSSAPRSRKNARSPQD